LEPGLSWPLQQEFFAAGEGLRAQTWIDLTEEVLASQPPAVMGRKKHNRGYFCVEKREKAGRIS
jgi:hypothetical protein